MSVLFSLNQVSKSYGDDTLFSDLTLDFKAKEQLGLIGMNGSGKSTLLKIIKGITTPDTGELILRQKDKFVYLAQEDKFDPNKSIETILYDSLRDEPIDDKERHKRVNQALGKGKFVDTTILAKNLSGGWTKRLAITRALCMKPDLLLLDEPTNHLDITGILWLEKILQTAPFSFIVISHDRTFLENVCANIMEIGKYYTQGYFKIQGQYIKFEKEREKFLIAQQKKQISLAGKMRREDQWLRQGAKARSTKAKYRIDQAEKLRTELFSLKNRNKHTVKMGIDFSATGRQTRKLLQAHNLKKEFQGKELFSNLTFELGPGFCLGVVGENGSGKSTLLSILKKNMEPDEGSIKWAENLRIAIFDQNRTQLNPEIPLREALNPAGGDSVNYKDRSIHVVTWAKRFLFLPDQLDMPIKRLSGGEKARIILANLMLEPCDILLLDEPTNDLDILSLEVLEQSIKEFAGAVIIVSHDRYLMDRVCHKILYLDPANGAQFYKDFNQILTSRQDSLESAKKTPQKNDTKKRTPREKSNFSYKDKYELEHIEKHILEAEEQVSELTEKIQTPQVIKDPALMTDICAQLEKAEEKVQDLYTRWEILEDKKAASLK
ncbi:MAG: ABC-F family ATP-binding cassette domain-containing protein [Desulfobacteraceae bacterium]|nr:ABC-F family ATP-binding cassette domain-containing protein [Desulfobacteraceae bacterium]